MKKYSLIIVGVLLCPALFLVLLINKNTSLISGYNKKDGES